MLERVRKYFASFEDSVIHGVQQTLEVFECCDELLEAINLMQEEISAEIEQEFQREVFKHMEEHPYLMGTGEVVTEPPPPGVGYDVEVVDARRELKIIEPPRPVVIIGLCPKCGSLVKGDPVPYCESELSGRLFYKECSECTWYAEVFKIGDKYQEVEGG